MLLEEILDEAMTIADVSMSDAEKKGVNYEIRQKIDGQQFVISFYPGMCYTASRAGADRKKSWAVEFRTSIKTGLRKTDNSNDPEAFKLQNFNKGLEFKLLPVVLGYMADFLRSKHPDALMFSADKSEKSRVSLYNKLIKRYQSKLESLGYKLVDDIADMDEFGSSAPSSLAAFVLIRKDLKNETD